MRLRDEQRDFPPKREKTVTNGRGSEEGEGHIHAQSSTEKLQHHAEWSFIVWFAKKLLAKCICLKSFI